MISAKIFLYKTVRRVILVLALAIISAFFIKMPEMIRGQILMLLFSAETLLTLSFAAMTIQDYYSPLKLKS